MKPIMKPELLEWRPRRDQPESYWSIFYTDYFGVERKLTRDQHEECLAMARSCESNSTTCFCRLVLKVSDVG